MWFSWLEAYSLHIMDDGRMLSSQSLFSLLDVSCCLGWDFITTASTTQLWDCVSAWRLWTALLVYFCPLIKSQSDTILKRPALRSNGALSLRPDYFLLGVLLTSDLCLDTLTWRPSQAWIYHSLNLFSSGSASLHGSYSLLVSHQSLTLRTRHYLATWISKYAGHSYFPESPLFLKKWSLMTFNRYSLSGAQLCEAQVFYSMSKWGYPVALVLLLKHLGVFLSIYPFPVMVHTHRVVIVAVQKDKWKGCSISSYSQVLFCV